MSDLYDNVLDFGDEPVVKSWHKQDSIPSKEEVIQRQTDFEQVLMTPAGKRVMGQLLSDLCFFRRCDTPEEVVLNNYSKKLLSYFGDWDVGSVDSIISKLL